ncbi:retrovirus-related pol polyprotein from transposon TNT 1-94 [Tanacetum coccineum]
MWAVCYSNSQVGAVGLWKLDAHTFYVNHLDQRSTRQDHGGILMEPAKGRVLEGFIKCLEEDEFHDDNPPPPPPPVSPTQQAPHTLSTIKLPMLLVRKESNTRPPVRPKFSWVFFLRSKDETNGILEDFIRQIKNQLNQKVKTIRCDNGPEFKNRVIIEFCGSKGIKREYNNARTPQQNGVAERKNKTLIKAARTMLADLLLPNNFWAEVVSTACYVLNRVLVTPPQNKTPYELITGKIPIISYIRPFGCHVTILNTIDHLVKFEEKSDEGFLVGYSLNSKDFRSVTAENKANKTAGPKEANYSADTQDNIDAGNSKMKAEPVQEYFVLPLWSSYTSTGKSSKAKNGDEKPNGDTGPKTNEKPKDQEDQAFLEELERLKRQEKEANDATEAIRKEFAHCTEDLLIQAGAARATSTNTVNTVSTLISTAIHSRVFSAGGPDLTNNDQDDS